MDWKAFVAVLCTALLTNLVNYLKAHPVEEITEDGATAAGSSSSSSTVAKVGLFFLADSLVMALAGCSMTRERMTISTPAVYAITTDAGGAVHSNLVSAATVTNRVKKERIWLPEGYALRLEQDVWGINVTPYDPTSQSAKVQAGVIATRATWLPSSTNELHTLPMTAQSKVNNKAVPFFMSAGGQFTSGEVRSEQTDTNATATAIVPGTPNDQTNGQK